MVHRYSLIQRTGFDTDLQRYVMVSLLHCSAHSWHVRDRAWSENNTRGISQCKVKGLLQHRSENNTRGISQCKVKGLLQHMSENNTRGISQCKVKGLLQHRSENNTLGISQCKVKGLLQHRSGTGERAWSKNNTRDRSQCRVKGLSQGCHISSRCPICQKWPSY